MNKLRKLEIYISKRIFSKAKEIYDLSTLKVHHLQLNDKAKIIICIDISCELLGIAFDTPTAVQHSAVGKNPYFNSKKTFMKLLNLNKKLNVADVLNKVGVLNDKVLKTAKLIFIEFLKSAANQDVDHPQYVIMSCWQACKVENVKAPRKKFTDLCHLNVDKWNKLELSWDWQGSIKKGNQKKVSKTGDKENGQTDEVIQNKLKRKLNAEPELEDYDVWAERILAKAHAQLKRSKTEST